uniref:Neur_chan_LBD domain-containing protein n=1 Tax=Rhabditophanes sp. KR3021 TaxID=114890 RepID=A0AC35UBJ7_9BILA
MVNETTTKPQTISKYGNASALLNELLSDYDIRLRPGFGGEALVLHLDIIISSFDAVSEVNMACFYLDFTVTMYIHQMWRDERLSFSSEIGIDEFTLPGEFSNNIWLPDTFLANDKKSFIHDVTEKNKMLRIDKDGNVSYGMKISSTLSANMDLSLYPLDFQTFNVEIESYGYTTSDVKMVNISGTLSSMIPFIN